MKAVIFYQDPNAAMEAQSALQFATRFPPVRVQWIIRPWRVDMLRFKAMAEEALLDAVDAHLIVFVGGCSQPMPPWLQDWMEEWATQRQIESATLAVMSHGNVGAIVSLGAPQLSQFAQRHGLGIIIDQNTALAVDSAISSENSPASRPAVFFFTQKPAESPLPPHAYRGWGLNE